MTANNNNTSRKSLFHFLLPLRSFGSGANNTVRVSVLHCDPGKHRFAPSLSFFRETSDTNEQDDETGPASLRNSGERLTLHQVQDELGTKAFPSAAWTRDYTEWRDWTTASNTSDDGYHSCDSACSQQQQLRAIPVFDSVKALHAFNEKGRELVDRLRHELQSINNNDAKKLIVEDFVPILSRVEVGETWWHVRDCHYGFVVPIQHLPVSADLKSRLQAWRFHKGECLLRTEQHAAELRQECRDLEESVVYELNARSDFEPNCNSNGTFEQHPWYGETECSASSPTSTTNTNNNNQFDLFTWNHSNVSSSSVTSDHVA